MQQIEYENNYQEAYYRAKCFNGIFTHDISNLFQIISNSIELCGSLLKDEINLKDIVEYFELIGQQVNRGKKLINNVRNLSKLEEHEMPLDPMEIYSTLRSAIRFIQLSFPGKNVDINIIPESGNLYVIANKLLLDVFENLLMNSINYNKNDVIKITINVSTVENNYKKYIKLEFQDNGMGIDDVQKEKLFHGGNLQSTLSKGMGIGLSLVSKFLDLCEGKISIEDRIMGDHTQGCNFILLIPEIKIIWCKN